MDRLYINGEPLQMARDTRITLTYTSPILTDITKQVANYSQTINVPRTPYNEALLGLPLSLDSRAAGGTFRYRRQPARLERDGVTIAEGEAYLLDSSANDIAIAFVFGKIAGLEELKAYDGDINTLPAIMAIRQRTWTTTPDASLNPSQMVRPQYNTGITPAQMNAAKVGYYGAVAVTKILEGAAEFCGGITYSDEAARVLNGIYVMCKTANDSDYTASRSATNLTATGTATRQGQYGWLEGGEVVAGYHVVPAFSGTTAASGKYGEVVNQSVASVTANAYKASAEQRLTIKSTLMLQLSVTTPYDVAFGRLQQARLIANILGEDGELQLIEGPRCKTAYLFEQQGANYRYVFDFAGDWSINVDEGQVVQLRLQIPAPTNQDTSMGNFSLSGGASFVSNGLKTPIFADSAQSYHPSGNLPAIKPIDMLKNIAIMFGLYIAPSAGGLHIATLNEVIDNLGEADDWSKKIIIDDRGYYAKNHYFSVGDYKAQRNVIKYKEDNNDIDAEKIDESARNVVLLCDNEGLEREKVLATLPFAATRGNAMKHYTYKEEDGVAEAERTELQPRIVRLSVVDNVVQASFVGLAGRDIASTHLQGLQRLIKQPHRIKVNALLTTWDITNLDLTRPVYLEQAGSYFLIESVQTTKSDICEVELLKI